MNTLSSLFATSSVFAAIFIAQPAGAATAKAERAFGHLPKKVRLELQALRKGGVHIDVRDQAPSPSKHADFTAGDRTAMHTPKTQTLLKDLLIGDVIRSKSLSRAFYGVFEGKSNRLFVHTRSLSLDSHGDDELSKLERASLDKSRGEALWVVESVSEHEGGSAQGGDHYPDYLSVTARRLSAGRTSPKAKSSLSLFLEVFRRTSTTLRPWDSSRATRKPNTAGINNPESGSLA